MEKCQYQSDLNIFNMEIQSVFSLIAAAIPFLIQTTDACNGYRLYVDYFRNCGTNDDVVLLSDDFRPVLNDDCTITMNGCMRVKSTIKTSHVSYDFTKNGAHYSGTKNACQVLDTAHGEVLSVIDSIDGPRHCPVIEGNICGHGKQVNIRKHRIRLPMMAGTTIGKMELKTNAGNACFEFSATLNRPRLFSG